MTATVRKEPPSSYTPRNTRKPSDNPLPGQHPVADNRPEEGYKLVSIIDYLPDDVSDDGYESLDSNVARSDAKDISGHEEESLTATKGSKAGPTFYGEPCTLALIKYPWKKSAMENPSGLNKLFSRLSPSRSLQWYQDRWASIFSDQSHDYESFKVAANTFVEDFLSTFDVDRKQPGAESGQSLSHNASGATENPEHVRGHDFSPMKAAPEKHGHVGTKGTVATVAMSREGTVATVAMSRDTSVDSGSNDDVVEYIGTRGVVTGTTNESGKVQLSVFLVSPVQFLTFSRNC